MLRSNAHPAHRSCPRRDSPRRIVLALLLLLSLAAALAGCGADSSTPRKTIHHYFKWVGRDPIRVLPYLTDDYHLSHGLTVAKLENFTWGHRAYIDPARATGANPDLAPTDAESGVAGARFAWLMIQIAPNYQQVARELEYEIVRVFGTDTEATVDVVIGRGLSFRQKFELKREGPGDRWRIDGASQEGVLKTTSYLAFVAFPTEPMMKAVSSALGLDAKTRTSMRSRARRRAARRGEAEQSPTTPQ